MKTGKPGGFGLVARWVLFLPKIIFVFYVSGFGCLFLFGFINITFGLGIEFLYQTMAIGFITAFLVVFCTYLFAPSFKLVFTLISYGVGLHKSYGHTKEVYDLVIEMSDPMVFYSTATGGGVAIILVGFNLLKSKPELMDNYVYKFITKKFRI